MAVGSHLLPQARQGPLARPVEGPIRDALTIVYAGDVGAAAHMLVHYYSHIVELSLKVLYIGPTFLH